MCSKLSMQTTLLRANIDLFCLSFRTRTKLRSLSGLFSTDEDFFMMWRSLGTAQILRLITSAVLEMETSLDTLCATRTRARVRTSWWAPYFFTIGWSDLNLIATTCKHNCGLRIFVVWRFLFGELPDPKLSLAQRKNRSIKGDYVSWVGLWCYESGGRFFWLWKISGSLSTG